MRTEQPVLGPWRLVPCVVGLAVAPLGVPSRALAQEATPPAESPAPAAAPAAAPAPAPAAEPPAPPVHEEILGWDGAARRIRSVRRVATEVPGLTRPVLVESADDGTFREIPLVAEADMQALMASPADRVARQRVEAAAAREIARFRAGLDAGRQIGVQESTTGARTGCTSDPYPARTFALPDQGRVQIQVASGTDTAEVTLSRADRQGTPFRLAPARVTLPGGDRGTTARTVPYDRLVDAREFSGTDRIAFLFRSDACLPAGIVPSALAVVTAPPPPPERPFVPAARVALDERAVGRVLVGRLSRRDGPLGEGWYAGTERVVFDGAWSMLGSVDSAVDERLLVQYTRVAPSTPIEVAGGGLSTPAFAVVSRRRSTWTTEATFSPPAGQAVRQGVNQDAAVVDLDEDGTPDTLLVVAHTSGRGDSATVLHWDGAMLTFVWRTDTRSTQAGSAPGRTVRRQCTLGTLRDTIVSRCDIEERADDAPAGQPPLSASRVVERARWNGGATRVETEQR